MRCRGEANNHQSSCRVTETGHALSPVLIVSERRSFLDRYLFSPGN